MTFCTYVVPMGLVSLLRSFEAGEKVAIKVNRAAWTMANINGFANIFILAICHNDVRKALAAWFKCKTTSNKNTIGTNGRKNKGAASQQQNQPRTGNAAK